MLFVINCKVSLFVRPAESSSRRCLMNGVRPRQRARSSHDTKPLTHNFLITFYYSVVVVSVSGNFYRQ